jgi:hypothetical protein
VTSERDYSISGLINESIANFKFTFVGFYFGKEEVYLKRLLSYCINVGACLFEYICPIVREEIL